MSRCRHVRASSIEANHIYDQYIDIQFAVIVLGEALDDKNHNQAKQNYTFFQFSSHPRILISGILGKDEVRPPLFIYIFSSPNPNFGMFWEKWSWTQLIKVLGLKHDSGV